jgi:hypothetical protein
MLKKKAPALAILASFLTAPDSMQGMAINPRFSTLIAEEVINIRENWLHEMHLMPE